MRALLLCLTSLAACAALADPHEVWVHRVGGEGDVTCPFMLELDGEGGQLLRGLAESDEKAKWAWVTADWLDEHTPDGSWRGSFSRNQARLSQLPIGLFGGSLSPAERREWVRLERFIVSAFRAERPGERWLAAMPPFVTRVRFRYGAPDGIRALLSAQDAEGQATQFAALLRRWPSIRHVEFGARSAVRGIDAVLATPEAVGLRELRMNRLARAYLRVLAVRREGLRNLEALSFSLEEAAVRDFVEVGAPGEEPRTVTSVLSETLRSLRDLTLPVTWRSLSTLSRAPAFPLLTRLRVHGTVLSSVYRADELIGGLRRAAGVERLVLFNDWTSGPTYSPFEFADWSARITGCIARGNDFPRLRELVLAGNQLADEALPELVPSDGKALPLTGLAILADGGLQVDEVRRSFTAERWPRLRELAFRLFRSQRDRRPVVLEGLAKLPSLRLLALLELGGEAPAVFLRDAADEPFRAADPAMRSLVLARLREISRR